jgi:pimeloyl-ACP methyl ester carboxylesterase
MRAGVASNRPQFYKDLTLPFYGYNRPGSETNFTEDLKKVDVPTLVLHGDDDQIVPFADAGPLSAKLVQGPELVHEADSGIELREASDPLFDAGHADQHHADAAIVKDRPDCFKTVHVQSICFIHEDQSRWIRHGSLERLETFEGLEVGRIDRRSVTR